MDLSVVVPVYNEQENVPLLYGQLIRVLEDAGRTFEILFVDDGSRDHSRELLKQLANTDPRVKLILFRRNYGQTAAMQAGIQHASGDTIVTLDGDLKNDPADIPMMLATIEQGYDLVHGWRKDR